MAKYKCDRCGKETSDAFMYYITKYFNGREIVQKVCLECIEKIGPDKEDISDG